MHIHCYTQSLTVNFKMCITNVSSASADTNSRYADVPLTALSKATRCQLSQMLNSRKILRSDEGYERDWRGLALLSDQKIYCDDTSLSGHDPLAKVLKLWCLNNPQTATFGTLERYLCLIDRWDVCDDIFENLVNDGEQYQQQLHKQTSASNDVDVARPLSAGADANILTNDDVKRAQQGLPPQMYDAFVLFADADANYAIEMITKLEENPEYQFKLCIKDRDLLAGVSFTHVALTQLIEERCKHLIVILTEEFIKSTENNFLVNYTQALQIQHNTRKIIPLLYDDNVAMPRTLKIYTHLRYNATANRFVDFWSKLASSMRDVSVRPHAAQASLTSSKPSSFAFAQHNVEEQQQQQQQIKQLSELLAPPVELPMTMTSDNTFVLKSHQSPPISTCAVPKKKRKWLRNIITKKIACAIKF